MPATVDLSWLLDNYRPGSQDDDWTWDDEERWLHHVACFCNTPVIGGVTSPEPDAEPCPTPGHYQKRLEAHLSDQGQVTQPVLLGNDGRVWDGHHRIVAARRLGFTRIPIEE